MPAAGSVQLANALVNQWTVVKFSLLLNLTVGGGFIDPSLQQQHSHHKPGTTSWTSNSFQIQCPFLTIPSQYRMNAGRVLWSFLCKLRDTLLRSNAAAFAFIALWFIKHRLVPLCCSRCAWRSKVAGHLSQDQITGGLAGCPAIINCQAVLQ